MSEAKDMEKLLRESKRKEMEHKREAMERSAVELFQYFRTLRIAGFTKKQAMKIVIAVAGRNRK